MTLALLSLASLTLLAAATAIRRVKRECGHGGAFRFSRNPQNVGVALMLVGISLLMDSALALLMAPSSAHTSATKKHTSRGSSAPSTSLRTPRFLGLPPPAIGTKRRYGTTR